MHVPCALVGKIKKEAEKSQTKAKKKKLERRTREHLFLVVAGAALVLFVVLAGAAEVEDGAGVVATAAIIAEAVEALVVTATAVVAVLVVARATEVVDGELVGAGETGHCEDVGLVVVVVWLCV